MTAVLTSHQLIERYELHGAILSRWRNRGWVRPDRVIRGNSSQNGNEGSHWPTWTDRMVRLLLLEHDRTERGGSELVRETRNALFNAVADALAEDPDVRWVVVLDGSDPVPCRHADEVVAVLADTRAWATIVAIPLPLPLDAASVPA